MKKLFMAVIALMMTISASAQFYIYYSDGTVAKVDSISMVAPIYNEDLGIGVFSIGEGRTVTFSKGNLQYTRSTNTWSFAENQWDYIGTDNVTGGSVSSSPINGNSKSGIALADKVDLFGWSTSSTNCGVSTSTKYADYSGSFVDWGTNQICNDAPNTWRTLTKDEWEYVLFARPNADNLKGIAQVNGVNGLILLPNNWSCPVGVTFRSGFYSNSAADCYAACQIFTTDDWSKMEKAGAVFLPAGGSRYDSSVSSVQNRGGYWSATEVDNNYAYSYGFNSGEAYKINGNRYNGLSVRLIKEL